MPREIILDIEATGILTSDGHRILEVTALEMIDGKLTGREFNAIVNPDRDIPEDSRKVHGITEDMVKDKPYFPAIARGLYDFIGKSPIVITCRTQPDGYVLDKAFLNMEMEKAGFPPFKDDQWVNVRRWSEEMFGMDNAKLNKVLDHYKIKHPGRHLRGGHGATMDAKLLAVVYPMLQRDYAEFLRRKKPPNLSAPKP